MEWARDAKAGAVGVLVRSLTHALDTLPHTGSMRYEEGISLIPAAVSTVDASAPARRASEEVVTVAMRMVRIG